MQQDPVTALQCTESLVLSMTDDESFWLAICNVKQRPRSDTTFIDSDLSWEDESVTVSSTAATTASLRRFQDSESYHAILVIYGSA